MNTLFDQNNALKQYKADWRLYPKKSKPSLKPSELSVIKPRKEALAKGVIIVVLKNVWQNQIITRGLTHRQPSLADSTIRQLSSLDWSFHPSARAKNTFVIPSSTPKIYTEGVLFTGEYNKNGKIFIRFLSMIDQKPKKSSSLMTKEAA
jgi:hypothetical protein